jgi:hypothetical protein
MSEFLGALLFAALMLAQVLAVIVINSSSDESTRATAKSGGRRQSNPWFLGWCFPPFRSRASEAGRVAGRGIRR